MQLSERLVLRGALMPLRLNQKLLLLALAAGAFIFLFLTYGVSDWGFAIPRRGQKLLAIALVGFAIAYSTVIFQTLTNNRILTPTIIGFDALYLVIQTATVFLFGATALTMVGKTEQFVFNAGAMVLFAGMLYRWLFGKEGRNLYVLVLVGIVFGSLFGSLSSFMQMLISPNDFVVLQDRMFASFNNVKTELLGIASVAVLLAFAFSLRYARYLDVLSLGREQAINLGVDYQRVVNRFMVVIAILVSVSTALVGPITFFGLIVANLAHQWMQTYRHLYLVSAAVLLSLIALVGGQFLVERVFTFSTSLSVIVNFIGGAFFIYLLLRESRL